MKISSLYSVFLVVSFCVACESQDVKKSVNFELNKCNYSEISEKALDREGIIAFDSVMETYNLYSGVDGSYDSQIVGVICNLPEEFQKNNIEVIFSGKYFKFEGNPPRVLPGQSYFNLELEEIELKN